VADIVPGAHEPVAIALAEGEEGEGVDGGREGHAFGSHGMSFPSTITGSDPLYQRRMSAASATQATSGAYSLPQSIMICATRGAARCATSMGCSQIGSSCMNAIGQLPASG